MMEKYILKTQNKGKEGCILKLFPYDAFHPRGVFPTKKGKKEGKKVRRVSKFIRLGNFRGQLH